MIGQSDRLVLIDGVQEVGAMSVNVKESGVDFYCAGGEKWIGNPFGMGFFINT
ncbi:aminotransferase class V-fold PLP-dependent enzyme [Bacillus sp. JJ1773]|uniref:aminotransferase class V-fold PLP-dependent enzyme n=1 Tax=Bacillus sp. JJ1773 TaxID=3122965 RepID=UPI003F68B74F